MTILKKLEKRYCINDDRSEVQQSYLRISIFGLCAVYCFSIQNTPYLRAITTLAMCATVFWIIVGWRRIGNDAVRHMAALAYDCAIIGLVMVGLGSNFMGLFAVLLWISIGYGIRYRSPLYLKLGVVFAGTTFVVSALVTQWHDWTIFITLLVTLVVIPLFLQAPVTKILNLLKELDVANKDLAEANKTKTKFISNVSHDLLTPVSSIIGYCEVMPPSIDGIRISAYQLTRQIRAILGSAASEDLSYEEYNELFRIDDLLQQTAIIVKPLAESQHIQVRLLETNVTGWFLGPLHAISICLINLANNAAKHSEGNTILLGASYRDGALHFSVADNGRGIPDEDKVQIFNRFFRSAHSNGKEGLGLGLAIVKDTIDKISGTIDVETSMLGTLFKFSVPATIEEAPPTPALSESNSVIRASRNQSILFVDDEFLSRKAWTAVLRNEGYYVHAASSGPEALAAIESGNTYHACVLDFRMPEMSGIEAAKMIRDRIPDMKVIILSAEGIGDQKEIFEDAIRSGLIDEALGKPIRAGLLIAAISKEKENYPSRADQSVVPSLT